MQHLKTILTCLIFIISFITPSYPAVNQSEETVDSFVKNFQVQKLNRILQNNLNKELKGLEFEDYYLLGKVCEGIIRYHEVKENQSEIRETAKTGINIINKALDINPEHSDSHRLLSRFYAKILTWNNGYDIGPKIMKELELALKYNPDNLQAQLGETVVSLYAPPLFGGNVDLALKQLKEFTDKHPDFEDGLFNLAIAHKTKGNRKKAKVILKAILEKNPNNLSARKELQKLGFKR